MSDEKKIVSPSVYNAFVETLALERVRMAEAHITTAVAMPRPSGTRIRLNYNPSYQNSDDGFEAFASYKVSFVDIETEEPQGDIEAIFALLFKSDTPMSDDVFEVFARINLKMNTWPFLREFLQSSMSRMDWPVFPLPLLRPQGKGNQEKPAIEEAEAVENAE